MNDCFVSIQYDISFLLLSIKNKNLQIKWQLIILLKDVLLYIYCWLYNRHYGKHMRLILQPFLELNKSLWFKRKWIRLRLYLDLICIRVLFLHTRTRSVGTNYWMNSRSLTDSLSWVLVLTIMSWFHRFSILATFLCFHVSLHNSSQAQRISAGRCPKIPAFPRFNVSRVSLYMEIYLLKFIWIVYLLNMHGMDIQLMSMYIY
jgi:hypothetical protein